MMSSVRYMCWCSVLVLLFFFFSDTPTPEIYTYVHTLSLHDALPISRLTARPALAGRIPNAPGLRRPISQPPGPKRRQSPAAVAAELPDARRLGVRSEEHTSELQSLMRISYAVFCLKKKKVI